MWRRDLPGEWRERTSNILSGYRFVAFGIAAIQLSLLPPPSNPVIPPELLAVAVGVYTLFRVVHPIDWLRGGTPAFTLLGVDIAGSLFLIILTGGMFSPYLLYTLVPVLTAALFLNIRVTIIVAGLSVAYVIGSHASNPFPHTRPSLTDTGPLLVYIVAVCLSAALPYLINVNLRQRLESEDMVEERRRLSHEIHDGTLQTVSALGWQVQLLNRRLAEIGVQVNEAGQLAELAEKARQNALDSLGLLRSAASGATFLARLKDYLKESTQDIGIDFRVEARSEDLHLETPVELELLRICQEAVTNARKHSGASSCQIRLRPAANHRLGVTIADDGRGFDAAAEGSVGKGRGLVVMRERAESIGATFQISSIPGQGTEVRLGVPLAHR